MKLSNLLQSVTQNTASIDGNGYHPLRPTTAENTFFLQRVKAAWRVLAGTSDAIEWDYPTERVVRHGGADMELRNCVSGEAKFVALWHQICDEQDADQRKWVDSLRASGFKAAHPNDGWVNRKDNEVYFAYPQFNDGAAIGDLVMLGWPWDKKSWRTVRLIGMRATALGKMVWWQFEDMPNV